MSIKKATAISNEIDQELDTVDAIFADNFERCENDDHAFNIRLHHQCNIEVIVSFKLKNYPKEQPVLAFRYVLDKDQLLKSVHKQSLQKCVVDKIEQSAFDSDGYLFEFVQTVVDSVNVFFEKINKNVRNESKPDDMDVVVMCAAI
eukprot:926383_1